MGLFSFQWHEVVVAPVLYQTYTREEAVAAFGDSATAKWFCQDQFAVLPKAILCLATVGKSTAKSHLSAPTCFNWRPRGGNHDPTLSDNTPWLPRPVREVWDRTQRPALKLRDHHIFLRAASDDRFMYVGPAHLGSYGSFGKGVAASFTLNEKVPREAWLRFGGYPGWCVNVNHRDHLVAPGDLAKFEKLLSKLPEQEFSHLSMTRYEEDALTVHTNARRGWLMYTRHPVDSGLYTRDLEYRGKRDVAELFECVCGIDLEFPAHHTLPREQALLMAKELFQSGRKPAALRWEMET